MSRGVRLRNDARVAPRSAGKKRPSAKTSRKGKKRIASIQASDTDASFELLFTSNPHPTYLYDARTLEFLEVNNAAIEKYGYSRQEFLRMRITDIRPPDELTRLTKALKTWNRELTPQGHWAHRRKDGRVFTAEVTTQGIEFKGRHATLTVAQDVSARITAEQQAVEHTAYLQALMEKNPLAVVVLDTKRRVEMCNPAFEQLFGYQLKEILGREFDSLIAPPGQVADAVERIERATAGETVRDRSWCRRRDGSPVEVQSMNVPLVLNGNTAGSFGIYEDITYRRRAEDAQRLAEEKFRCLFENAVEGIFQSTPEGTYLSVNPALARMYGYSSPEDMMREIRDIGNDLYLEPWKRDAFKQLMEEHGVVEAFEYQVRRKDGRAIWISESSRAVADSTGRIVSYEGTVEDITDRKRSELERQVTSEIIHSVTITDRVEDLLRLIHAALGKVLYAQNCFVALSEPNSGIFHFPFFTDQFDPPPSPGEIGHSCSSYVYRSGTGILISPEVFQELVRQGEVELIGTPSRSWLGVPLRTPAATIGVLVVQNYEDRDVYTERDLQFLSSVGGQIAFAIERKRSEERLRESEARGRVLIEQLPAVLWTVDKNLRFTSALGAGLARLGIKPNEIVGMFLPDYFESSDQTFLPIAAHRRAVAGEAVTFHVEWKEGSYACHVEPLRGTDGDAQGAICMALDITDRKQLEEQFRQAQKMEAVGRLAGGIAHDFNNLLMVIQGYADLLAERLMPGDPLRRNAEQIQLASQRATSLTQQLLAFSRKQILAPKVLNVQVVIGDMENILRRLLGEDVRLEISPGSDLGLIKADRSQIEQVIMNLAVNARDAMPEGGRLLIETANTELDSSYSAQPAVISPGEYVMLAVTDSGCGMDAKTQAHIFEPFFTTKEQGKGTGLGLATVYGIVKQSGGYIWVYSEPGHGTTFKVYLPRIDDQVTATGRDLVERKSLPRGSEMILLVEDEKGVRELAREYLETSGYSVIEAPDGDTALALAERYDGNIHLMMTDVVMPGMSGRELADRISRMRPGIKVLFMSGYTDQAIVRHGILATDTVLLQKPFTLGTLASKLREVLAAETVH